MGVAQSRIGFMLMVAGLAGLIFGRAIVSAAPLVIAGQALAICLMLWARVTFGRRSFHATATPTEGGIVTHGPYRFIRHPIYASVCLFAWASSLGHLSVFSAVMALLLSAGAAMRIKAEEGLLLERYPDYADYAARTKRIVPFVF
jgi:protein-S-isoprenylcysteine O-methyltransferase Ste14